MKFKMGQVVVTTKDIGNFEVFGDYASDTDNVFYPAGTYGIVTYAYPLGDSIEVALNDRHPAYSYGHEELELFKILGDQEDD